MNLWATLTQVTSAPPRKAPRQRAPFLRPAARSRARATMRPARRAPPVLRVVPKPRPKTLAALTRTAGRGGPVQPPRSVSSGRFTDIGTVGYDKGAHGEDTSQVRTIDAYLSKVPIVGGIAAKAIETITGIGAVFADLISAGNAAGLSPQQLDAISAGIKKGGAVAAGSVLNQVEGRAGTKQLFDPDEPGGYRTVGGRFRDGL